MCSHQGSGGGLLLWNQIVFEEKNTCELVDEILGREGEEFRASPQYETLLTVVTSYTTLRQLPDSR